MKQTVAVIAAHPDDEVLGCGATIAQHVKAGDKVQVLILAEGLTSRGNKTDSTDYTHALSALAQAAHQANAILGTHSLKLHHFPDNRLDSLERLELIKVVEAYLNQYQPSIVYTHHAGDVNIDHRRINEAVITACRPMPTNKVTQLLFFEVASSTEWQPPGTLPAFQPHWFVNVSDTLSTKLAALQAYESEMRPWPHARSLKAIEHLAHWRGATIGVDAAEAFMLGRYIQHFPHEK